MSSFREGYEQGKFIGNIFTLGFRIAWFFARIVWWLSIFLIASIVAGVAALAKRGQSASDVSEGFGKYSDDRSQWQDQKTGQWYPVRRGTLETCEVEAIMGGFHWRRMALSRLVKRGAISHFTFAAVRDEAPGAASETVASSEFLNEARHNITLDHLDPARAAEDIYGLGDNRAEAESALAHLDWLLTNRGWTWNGTVNSHWYARIYERPAILWGEPVVTGSVPAGEG
ncbi:MAG TPA: hypothetical protein DHU96_00405 [Actinobacteria bacterium]|nr:hypothetical protein [Actinomycetota bacterium]